MNSAENNIKKAFGMPSADGTHQYIFKSGEYGTLYQYWWRDRLGNYYRYSNAAEGTPDFDPFFGAPLLDNEQPLPEKNPTFFTEEGFKRHMAVPEGVEATRNENYNQNDSRNIWFEVFDQKGKQYVYLDADVKENLDLYVQQQLRIADAGLKKFRSASSKLFNSDNSKDKITGALLMLCDQGFYDPDELVNAKVSDIQFVDQTVILLGRKFVADLQFLDFITSLVAMRGPEEPLFKFRTMHGELPVGINYLNGVFFSLKISPKYLLSWNASHLFSRIVNRMAFQQIPSAEVEGLAFNELARTLSTRDDVKYLVDYKVRVALLRAYANNVNKSLSRLFVDDFGIAVVRSDLADLRTDEKEFSDWLHAEPMHDLTPQEEEQVMQERENPEQSEEEEPDTESAQPAASPEDAEEPPPTKPTEVPE